MCEVSRERVKVDESTRERQYEQERERESTKEKPDIQSTEGFAGGKVLAMREYVINRGIESKCGREVRMRERDNLDKICTD